MTRKEMTEIFSVMKLAFPGAEMFRGGLEQLKPTVELWTSCLSDVDFWTGKQAVIRVCRTCKFPPTIAEFRTQAETVRADIDRMVNLAIQEIRSSEALHGSLGAWYDSLPDHNPTKRAIATMGGVEAMTRELTAKSGKVSYIWQWDAFTAAYTAIIQENNMLPGNGHAALPGTQGGT